VYLSVDEGVNHPKAKTDEKYHYPMNGILSRKDAVGSLAVRGEEED
jgi:hypothetical protein